MIAGNGSAEDGVEVIERLLREAGAAPQSYDLSDGSGLSVYNRITPHAMARFIYWAGLQGWGEEWRNTLPVGGVDGTLESRFAGTPLEGRIYAKTGTLFGVNALSGFMRSARGEMLTFAIMVNDRPSTSASANAEIDAVLLKIAAAH
ncbi:MAG: D-alanyl-D-alanine carboxypeptidase [Pseudomonadota bacterium]